MKNSRHPRPAVVVALPDHSHAQSLCACFAQRGWSPHPALTGPETREVAQRTDAEIVVLGTTLPEESGWLSTEKLMREMPRIKVFLVGQKTTREERLSEFVGAVELLDENQNAPEMVDDICGLAPILVA